MKVRRTFVAFTLASLLTLVATGPAFPQAVSLTGRLTIGFGDQTYWYPFSHRIDSAFPKCAAAGSLVHSSVQHTTVGTLLFNAIGEAAPGVGSPVTFRAVGGGDGGAQQKVPGTCFDEQTPFTPNWHIRSFVDAASAHFPGRKGKITPMITTAPVPTTPTATYVLSAGGGHTAPITVMSWTTMNEGVPPGSITPAPIVTNTFTGSAFETALFRTATATHPGVVRVQPGAGRFGGGLPFSGGTVADFGLYFGTYPGGTPTDYGQGTYDRAIIRQSPFYLGTDAKGVNAIGAAPPPSTFPRGYWVQRTSEFYSFRTPGGSTQHQHGAIMTLNGGNTVTQVTGGFPPGIALQTPVGFVGRFFEWTTGAVTYTDQIGENRTVRKAQGYDVAVASSTAVSGETRRLQVVTPWSASVRPAGAFGFPRPDLVVGGVAVLTLNVVPAPEPAITAGLAAGLAGLYFAARRRSVRV